MIVTIKASKLKELRGNLDGRELEFFLWAGCPFGGVKEEDIFVMDEDKMLYEWEKEFMDVICNNNLGYAHELLKDLERQDLIEIHYL